MQSVALREPLCDVHVSQAVPLLNESPFTASPGSIAIGHDAVQGTLRDGGIDALEMPAACRTLVHAYVPVRNEQSEIVDFRLTFDHAAAPEVTRSFAGIQVVQCGPSVAPGEIFHTLKQVLESGETQETVTRHVGAGQTFCFYQTAAKSGDVVVTTTSIVTLR